MLNTDLQSLRNEDKLKEFRIAFNISAIKLIGPLFPLFWIADLMHSPENAPLFLTLRLSVTVFCFGSYYLSKRLTTLKGIEHFSIFLVLYPSAVITYMIYVSDGIGSKYFVGLNLIAAGAICFFPWAYSQLPKVILAVYGFYFLLPIVSDRSQSSLAQYAVNVIFVLSTILISTVIRYIYETLKYKELNLRLKLNNEIEKRNEIIRTKTEEGIRLLSLGKQFSPQVVQAIDKGTINPYSILKKTKICCIFIDIVNSTEQVASLNKEDLNKVLSLFMSDTMKVLLKYDITIDKFLGDGVLAFSNAPIEISDYTNRVVIAATEILARINNSMDTYKSLWKKDFQIRIGIDTGDADVGFYGSDEYFKTFTAIGEVVNMSSRLCSIASPNTILVSHNVYTCISQNADYQIIDKGERKIKGFEKSSTLVYEVSSNRSHVPSDIPVCPQNHGVLSLDIDEKGIYKFVCRVCGHEKVDASEFQQAS